MQVRDQEVIDQINARIRKCLEIGDIRWLTAYIEELRRYLDVTKDNA